MLKCICRHFWLYGCNLTKESFTGVWQIPRETPCIIFLIINNNIVIIIKKNYTGCLLLLLLLLNLIWM